MEEENSLMTDSVNKESGSGCGGGGGGGEGKKEAVSKRGVERTDGEGSVGADGRKRAKTMDGGEQKETLPAVEMKTGAGAGQKGSPTDKDKEAGRKKNTKRELSRLGGPAIVFKDDSDPRKQLAIALIRPYHCIFSFASCPQTFSSKNEWKRHIYSQHLHFNYWRCDQSTCSSTSSSPSPSSSSSSPSPTGKNSFNRKDLFSLHIKRMHKTITTQEKIAEMIERCKRQRRNPPVWRTCGYCGRDWGNEEFGEKMEHVGGHLERDAAGAKVGDGGNGGWKVDEEFVDWAVEEGIIEKVDAEEAGVVVSGGGEKAKGFDGRHRLVNVVKPGTRGLKPAA